MEKTIIWIIAILAIGGVIVRPFKVSEAVYALSGAALLVILKLITPNEALAGIWKGLDVYLFLIGMMLLAETAREEKVFDWLAAHATKMANGSPTKLFTLIYLVGVVVTTFLSNDAAAVVLTPAVAAAVKAADVKKPLPYLLICAFIANAASFVLPISNPANLVIYGSHMPALLQWLRLYIFPSVISILVTYFILRFTQRKCFTESIKKDVKLFELGPGGKTALIGIILTGIVLLIASAYGLQLGLPTAITGILTSVIVLFTVRKGPAEIIKGVSWAVIMLVAGLFIIVEALNKTGLTAELVSLLNRSVKYSATGAVWLSGTVIAFACNLMNNLPAGLIAGNVIQGAHVPETVKSAVLIGVDLGPNLSVTGSLATILWLIALRREGQQVSALSFLKLGSLVMTLALVLAIATILI